MDISVIICTFNRCQSLRRTLRSLTEIVHPPGLSFELIVVDNNSQDHTRTVCKYYKNSAPWNVSYIFEEKQGLSRARNRGIQTAQGEILAFLDDDVIVDRDWLSNLHAICAEDKVAAVGGRILPRWETPQPAWLIPDLYYLLALLDLGDKSMYLTYPDVIFGANFAVPAEMFRTYGVFNVKLGRIGERLFCHEELDFIHRLQKAGEKILYHPNLLVHHCISHQRLSKSYFRRWKFDAGASSAVLLQDLNPVNVLKMSGCRVKRVLLNVLFYMAKRLRSSPQRFIHELELIHDLSLLWHTFVARV